MRYIIPGVEAVLLNCTLPYSQEPNAAVKNGSTPPQATIALQRDGLGLQTPGNISARPLPSLDQLGNQTGDFVFVNGAAYMRLGGSLFPIAGGGASGCFSLQLTPRIERLGDFILRLGDRETMNPQDHDGAHGL